ncbi:MAG: baseplate assembly protein [Proteobacteria bacterium]|nr:baseplate assembly protein [Pseudomonadota bacterium]
MSRERGIVAQFVELSFRVAEIERRDRNRSRKGVVTEVDHTTGKARVKLSGDDEEPFKTGWIPWGEVAAGDIKTHIPPSVGQQVTVRSDNGDLTDAIVDMAVPSDANPRPHDGPEAVITKGSTRIEVGDDLVSIAATRIRMIADVEIDGDIVTTGSIVNNGKHVDSGHEHTNTMPGAGTSGPPV